MQNDLKDRIASLKALNAKRTQGEWHVSGHYVWGINSEVCRAHVVEYRTDQLDTLKFIAASPKMMAVITELEAEVERVKAQLDSPEMVCDVANAIESCDSD